MVNLEPRDDHTQFLGIGGSEPTALNPGPHGEKAQRRLVRMMHQSLGNIHNEISLQKTEKLELSRFLDTQRSILSCTPSIWPTKGWVSSTFGYRLSPFTNEREFHSGLDISNRTHSPILAPADGIVAEAGTDYGYGRIVQINHGYGLRTKYAHLEKILVKVGQHVKRGQQIATVGSSGRTTGPHLHYEVHLNGVPVDPLRYILN
ncbi:MAG: M23 family metallopeptidase [Deltaproteobacteria bacterium]|nr:M23 family metallopeptidase [Deltaproteobacteria bacterium]